MEKVRNIVFYQDYFFEFYDSQTLNVQRKIDEVLFTVSVLERVPRKFLDHLTGTSGLYEIRIELGGNIFRVFCCFDEGKIVVLFNGFQKKTQKTPKKEIDKAERLKNEYFKDKPNEKG